MCIRDRVSTQSTGSLYFIENIPMSYLRVRDLRDKSKDDLLKQLTDYKKELSQLRTAKKMGNAPTKIARIGGMRKNIARILTVLNQTERDNLRKFYADNKQALPKSLKPKLTHRRRLALKTSEINRKTRRQTRMSAKYPMRKFAVKM
eukprot:TRINITY_DN730_c0_g1_i11.p2 TRINITY_DN730_c0_g1~~TRINITY_DN730_c0_g1_i11.p2  ORF type:complete len:147 (+),score=64.44 TRINITY_DN730_c0_g1_i11:166-606(+)